MKGEAVTKMQLLLKMKILLIDHKLIRIFSLQEVFILFTQ